jgi:hypothetical protein
MATQKTTETKVAGKTGKDTPEKSGDEVCKRADEIPLKRRRAPGSEFCNYLFSDVQKFSRSKA